MARVIGLILLAVIVPAIAVHLFDLDSFMYALGIAYYEVALFSILKEKAHRGPTDRGNTDRDGDT